ncbi:MAG: helicase-related protein, partial [Acidimicrobiia bacterium]
MIYARSSSLERVGVVVLDEVHYLQDPFRGAVWEEVIIHAPLHLQLVCLSATIANAEEFAGWVESRRGSTELVVERTRPVPLESLYLIKDRFADPPLRLFPTFGAGARRPNPRVQRILQQERGRSRRFATPRRTETVELLAADGMLPAIFFIFSRAACDDAARRALDDGIRLIEQAERQAIHRVAADRTAHLSEPDLAVLDYHLWLACLEAGIAAHHAGLVPAFKETVEDLFAAGLVKVVFATETLALGINMPARTVVLDGLSRFTGESHELLQPGDYTQLTGRAGRRGIDQKGFGVVLHSRYVPFHQVSDIAAVGSHPLRSSFRPTYNMAANLIANYHEEEARGLLTASFAQYQRQEDAASAQTALAQLEERLEHELARAACELGDVEDYLGSIDQAARPPIGDGLSVRFRPGDVFDVPSGRRAGRFLALRRLEGKGRLLVLGTSGKVSSLGRRDLVAGTTRVGLVELPTPFRPSDRKFRQTALRQLRRMGTPAGRQPAPSLPPTPHHPVAACPDAELHLRWARRAKRTAQRVEQHRSALRKAGVGLVEDFEAIRRLLEAWGYVEAWSLTSKGDRLR